MLSPNEKPELMTYYFLRHGETEWNREGRFQGHLDSPLTVKGEAQASQLGTFLRSILPNLEHHTLYVSDLERCQKTAQLLTAAADWDVMPILDPRLREIDVGDWSGKLKQDFGDGDVTRDLGLEDLYALAPGGESYAALFERARDALTDMSQPAIVVTHGITSRFLRAAVMGKQAADAWSFPGGQGVVHRVTTTTHQTLDPSAARS